MNEGLAGDDRRLHDIGWLKATDGATEPLRLSSATGVEVASSAEPAAWVRSRLLTSPRGATLVGSAIPTGFPAYARVFHPARLEREGEATPVRWSDVARWAGREVHSEMQWETISQRDGPPEQPRPWTLEPSTGKCPRDTLGSLIDILEMHTASRDRCYVCVWEGWAGVRTACPNAQRVELPGRRYILLRAPLEAVMTGVMAGPGGAHVGLGIWWPDDRAWCVATEVDFRWTYVAGSGECIAQVLSDRRLEALPTRPEHRGDYMSDTVNGPVQPR